MSAIILSNGPTKKDLLQDLKVIESMVFDLIEAMIFRSGGITRYITIAELEIQKSFMSLEKTIEKMDG